MPWYVTVYELLLQVSLAGCVLLGVATVAVVLLREPARQIRVIELAMWGLLALPLVVLIPGYPRVALLPASEEPAPLKAASLVQPPALPRGPAPIDSPLPPAAELVPPRATTPTLASTPPPASTPPTVSTPQNARNIDAGPRESSAGPLPAPIWHLPTDYRLWIVCSYLTGVGILLAWSLVGFVALRRLVRASHPADAAARSALQAIAGDASARVRLLVSPRAAQPCAFGWLRPTIVLPQALLDSADSTALRFALAHEWSHVARGDVGVWTISGFARLLHFQQPLLWLLRQHLRRSQDYLADAAAAGAGTPEDYAEFLTSFSQSFKRPRLAPGLGIVSRRSDLHRRVVMLVEKQGSLERTPPRRWNAAILLSGLLTVAVVASLRAEPNDPQPTVEPTAEAKAKSAPPSQKGSDGNTRALSASPSNEDIEAALADDPQIRKLMQEQETLGMALRQSVVNGGTYNKAADNLAAHTRVTRLSREIAGVEEQIEQRKASLRSNLVGQGRTGQKSATTGGQPLHEAHTKRFMLGDDGLAQNQPTSAARHTPFSGKIRPGDILNIEMVGGFPGGIIPPRTVEPDGNIALSPAYGIERIAVGGKSLIEAGTAIATRLKGMLKDPRVLVTYAGHDPDVVSADEAARSERSSIPIAWEPDAVLEPLDTIELELPVKGHMVRQLVDGKLREVLTTIPDINDVYVIEPDGNIALPFRYGRVNIKGLTEKDAGNAIRKHLTEKWMPRTALPQVSVRKRGRAVFSPEQQPPADGRIRPGDSLLIGNRLQRDAFNYQVTAEGNLPSKEIAFLGGAPGQGTVPPLHVAGLSLAEAQDAIEKTRKSDAIIVTIGGWHEEAAPASDFTSELTTAVRTLETRPTVLEPLDTIQIRLGARTETLDGLNGTYLIEPDGRVALAANLGRIKLAGLTESQAGEAVRTYISTQPGQRKAPPSIHIVRRGRAVFPDEQPPAADYRVRAGDHLLANQGFSAADGGSFEVTADGMFQTQPDVIEPKQEPVHVAGLTLEEVQNTLREKWKFLAFRGTGVRQLGFPNPVWMVTLGGWHEEADPQLIDRLGESNDPRVQQLERELQQIKTQLRERR